MKKSDFGSLTQFPHKYQRICFSSGPSSFRLPLFALLLFLALPFAHLFADQLQQARVSQVIKDVKLLPAQAAPRPAHVSDGIRNGTAVRTGLESRAELTFTDQTLARLGANTIFTFDQGTRKLELGSGAMLLRVPKNAGGAQINTAAITAAITGTTVMLEFHPNAYIKFIILEGTGRIFRNDRVGESVLVHAGQMLIVNPNGKGLPDPVDVDLKRLMQTSLLINGFGPLASDDLIAQVINAQSAQKDNGGLIETNLVIFGGGTAVNLLDPTQANVINQANSNSERQPTPPPATPTPPPITPTPPPITPTPPPGKYGTLTAISSPVPYVISSGTTITTDPTVTTNGVTDYGKIYRSPSLDGPASAWLFGSTSSFDTQIGFDNFFNNPSNVPFAAFKFASLRLTGNPTISLANDGAKELALISVGDITSAPPGGTFTFSGIEALLLATQNGSITLTSDLTFQDIPFLAVYARGAESNLTFDAAVSGTSRFFLASEGNILATNSLTVSQTNNGLTNGVSDILNISLNAGGDIAIGGDLSLTTEASGVTKGGDIDVTSLSDTTIGGAFNLNIFSLSGTTGSGGNISVSTGGQLTVGDLSFTLDFNMPGVTVTDGANINLTVGGDLNAASLLATIDNSNSGNIGTGGNISVTVGGSLSTQGFLGLLVTNYGDVFGFPGTPVGQIGTGGNISVTAGGNLATDFVHALIDNRNGASINSGATISFNIGGALTTLHDDPNPNSPFGSDSLSLTISNRFDTTTGGTIGSDATINLTAASVSSGGGLSAAIFNFGNIKTDTSGGNIGGGAMISCGVSGDLVAQGDATFEIASMFSGAIGSDATINVNAANFTTDANPVNLTTGLLLAAIYNGNGGTIGSGASITFNLTGNLTTQGDASFTIGNHTSGTIGGNAMVSVSAASISTVGNLSTYVGDNDHGSIGGDALINFALSGDIDTQGEGDFEIFNDTNGTGGGTIGSGATINVSAANISIGGALFTEIQNTAGVIGGSALLNFSASGDISSLGDATFQIFNNDNGDGSGPGSIGSDAMIIVNAANLSSGGVLNASIFNFSGGSIGGNALINLSSATAGANSLLVQVDNSFGGTVGSNATISFVTSGSLMTTGDADFFLSNNDGGEIAGIASLLVSAGGDVTAGAINLLLNNRNSGSIGGDGLVLFNTSGTLTTTGDATFVVSNRDDGGGAGVISGNASAILTAGVANVGGLLVAAISEAAGGQLASGLAAINVAGDVTTGGGLQFSVQNGGLDPFLGEVGGGTIDQNALASLTATNVTIGDYFLGLIANLDGGQIGGTAELAAIFTGNLNVTGDAAFQIDNSTSMGTLSSSIGSDAAIGVAANDITAGSLEAQIFNQAGGSIGGNATIGFGLAGALTSQADAIFEIDNFDDDSGFGGGTIDGNATVSVTANSLSAASLVAQIDNTGGTIGGDATIDLNVSGSATISTDATVQILGSDGAAAAAININGGNYDAGGTFLALTDGNGTIAFTNATVHADVLKVGALGTNGVLNIGGGTLSADTTLELYAPGSNGQLNFISNVTLGGNGAKILAANSVTIFNNVVVTIGGANPADVYTGFNGNIPNANYTGSGGNGSTTGTFAGAGANNPQPLGNAPPFGPSSPATVTTESGATARTTIPPLPSSATATSTNVTSGKKTSTAIRIDSTDELLSLLDGAAPGSGRRITIPVSKSSRNLRNSSRTAVADRSKADRGGVSIRPGHMR